MRIALRFRQQRCSCGRAGRVGCAPKAKVRSWGDGFKEEEEEEEEEEQERGSADLGTHALETAQILWRSCEASLACTWVRLLF